MCRGRTQQIVGRPAPDASADRQVVEHAKCGANNPGAGATAPFVCDRDLEVVIGDRFHGPTIGPGQGDARIRKAARIGDSQVTIKKRPVLRQLGKYGVEFSGEAQERSDPSA